MFHGRLPRCACRGCSFIAFAPRLEGADLIVALAEARLIVADSPGTRGALRERSRQDDQQPLDPVSACDGDLHQLLEIGRLEHDVGGAAILRLQRRSRPGSAAAPRARRRISPTSVWASLPQIRRTRYLIRFLQVVAAADAQQPRSRLRFAANIVAGSLKAVDRKTLLAADVLGLGRCRSIDRREAGKNLVAVENERCH